MMLLLAFSRGFTTILCCKRDLSNLVAQGRCGRKVLVVNAWLDVRLEDHTIKCIIGPVATGQIVQKLIVADLAVAIDALALGQRWLEDKQIGHVHSRAQVPAKDGANAAHNIAIRLDEPMVLVGKDHLTNRTTRRVAPEHINHALRGSDLCDLLQAVLAELGRRGLRNGNGVESGHL
jgi:hypothetical protein